MTNGYVDYIGIDNNLPTNIKYFKEELVDTVFEKGPESKDIDTIVSTSIDCKIGSIELLNTQVRISNEGQKLSGKKLLVELNLSYRIKYITNSKQRYIYLLNKESTKVVYVVLPKDINGVEIEELYRKNKLSIEPFIEDLYSEIRSLNSVYIRTLLLININIKA